MRRPFAILTGATLMVAACNPPTPGGTAASPQDPTLVTYGGSSLATGVHVDGAQPVQGVNGPQPMAADRYTGATMGEAPRSIGTTLTQPATAVWPTVKRTYLALGIPVTYENPKTHQMGNPQFYATRRLADSLMSVWLDCGNGPTGLRANNDRVYMSLLTTVTTNASGGTNIETLFAARSIDMAGGASDMQACSSKGRLEQMIHETVRANTPK